jgi:hypothetical protein
VSPVARAITLLPAVLCDRRRLGVKRKRAPYARSNVWYAVIALSAVLVVGLVVATLEIVHLRSEVNSLQNQVESTYLMLVKLTQGT